MTLSRMEYYHKPAILPLIFQIQKRTELALLHLEAGNIGYAREQLKFILGVLPELGSTEQNLDWPCEPTVTTMNFDPVSQLNDVLGALRSN